MAADLVVSGAVTVQVRGNGDLLLVGSLGSLDLTSTGNGDVDVFGIKGDANVELEGNGDTFIGGSPQTVISGKQLGNGDLSYSGGSCDVKSEEYDDDDTCEKDDRKPSKVSLPQPSAGSYLSGASVCA